MKKIVFLVVGLLLLVTIPAIVYFAGLQQDIRSRAAPASTISFNPTTITKPVDEQFTVNIDINTGTNSVTAVKVVVLFDSTKLEATSITNGAFAPKITASGVVAAGNASITVAANSTTSPMQGTGTVAIIRFKGKAATTTPIKLEFDPTTFASGLTESTNVITTKGTASVIITGTTAAANTAISPTATPTASNAASQKLTSITPTPTTASVIPQDTPTPTASNAANATNSAALTAGDTSDHVPVTGAVENTISLLVVGISCILFSGFLYAKAKQTV